MKQTTTIRSVALATAIAATLPAAAWAANDKPKSDGLEEVIVTAQKRTQSFQSLAISADVVTAEEIESKGVTSVQDAIRLAAGVKIQNVAGTGSGRVFIRGIGTTSGDENRDVISNGVSILMDGVQSNNASNALNSLFDVERVEILKGPQGTLYGAGALGGVVSVVTADPKLDAVSATARLQFGNYDLKNYQGMLNLPMGDIFAVRINVNHNARRGYVSGPAEVLNITNATGPIMEPADNHGAVDSRNVRIKTLFQPNENFRAVVTYEHTKDSGTSPTWVNPADVLQGHLVCCNLDPTTFPPPLPDFVKRMIMTALWGPNRYYDRTTETWSGNFEYNLGWATVTFLPTTNKIMDKGQELTAAAQQNNLPSEQKQDTYELRLNSPADSKAVWVAGLYATKSARQLTIDTGLRGSSPDSDGNPATLQYSIFDIDKPFKTFSVYGQGTFPVAANLRATAGARWSKNDASYTFNLYRTANPGANLANDRVVEQSPTYSEDTSHPAFTWKVGLEYDLAEQSMLYANLSTGFKSGGVNAAPGIITAIAKPALGGYKNEKSTAFELGSKNRFLNNRLQLNGSLFYTKWNNMQLNTLVCLTPGCDLFGPGQSYVSWYNAGPSKQYGLEIDGAWKMSDNDRLNFSGAVMHGTYGTTNYAWGAPGFQGIVNLKGHKMAQTPSTTFNATYMHTFELGDFGTITASLDAEYSSDYETTHEYFFAGHTQPSYFRNNATLTYEKGNLQINGFIRNIQNKTTIQSVFPFGVQGGEPKVVGGSIQYKF